MDGIGQMRSVVIFRRNSPEPTDTGGQTDQYGNVFTTRGMLRAKSGSRELGFGEIDSRQSYELVVRYSAFLATIMHTSTRVRIDTVDYTITSWKLVDEIKRYYVISLSVAR